jgi:hypothetical protein
MDRLKSGRGRIGLWLLVAVWLGIGGLAVNAVWLTAFTQTSTPGKTTLSRTGAPIATSTPYTVVLQESTREPSGKMSLEGSLTLALREDGAFVTRYEHWSGPAVIQRTIELQNGVTVVVDDIRERRMSTRTRVGTSVRARMDSVRDCIKNDVGELVFPGQLIADRSLVLGYETVRVTSGPSTFWFARQLGCAQVKSSTQLADGVVNEKLAILVVPGEPDSGLFYLPERYTEVPPSSFYELDPNDRDAQQRDRSYYERQPPR